MISFIIIGKNEGFKLSLCINSIITYINTWGIIKYEIIYVDSQSTDGSIETVLKLNKNIIVAKLTANCNAAIARNTGAFLSKGTILFFIDGDMVLDAQNNFFQGEIDLDKFLLLSGQIENIIYDNDFNQILEKQYYYPNLTKDKTEFFFGGLFIISRFLWDSVGGMRTEFKYGEDLDLSIRLSKKRHFLTRKCKVLAYHHTTQRPFSLRLLIAGAMYSRGLLYRKNFFNFYSAIRVLKSDPTTLSLLFCTLLSFTFDSYYFMFLHCAILIAAIVTLGEKSLSAFATRLFSQIIRDFAVILSFLFFFPKKRKLNFILIDNQL